MKRVFFFVENASFAHPSRVLFLAQTLRGQCEVHLATRGLPQALQGLAEGFRLHEMQTAMTPTQFSETWTKNRYPWSMDSVLARVQEDQALIDQIKPDVVIGDLRIGLEVAAKRSGVPMISLTNSCWFRFNQGYPPVADNALSVYFPPWLESLGARVLGKRIVLNMLKEVRLAYRILGERPPDSPLDLFTRGDRVFFLDPPGLYPEISEDARYKFVGPVLFSLSGLVPERIAKKERQRVFLALGSTGRLEVIDHVLRGLSQLDVDVVMSTSGAEPVARWKDLHSGLSIYPFLPAREVIRYSDLVITNGGSPMTYLCLAEAKPSLMIPGNMDQQLCSEAVQAIGGGSLIRASQTNSERIKTAAQNLLSGQKKGELRRAQQIALEKDVSVCFPKRLWES